MTNIICGVDVSSKMLDAQIGRKGPFRSFANTPEGINALAAFCTLHGVQLVVMEATGGYEKQPFALLWAHGLAAAIVNPRAVRRFAEAVGLLEKTDRIDAGVIAWFAEVKAIKASAPPTAAQARLTACVTRLRQLTALKTAQTNQRRLVTDPALLASFAEMIALIVRQIRDLEGQIAQLINRNPLWQVLEQAFRSIKGVASRTIARIMADMPEIGTLSGKAVAKLAGLAPIANDSGSRNGRRAVRGGRQSIRDILFIVAGVVRKYDPDFAEFHKRLSDAGKPKKVIRVALAHKLLTRLNAKARDARKQLIATP